MRPAWLGCGHAEDEEAQPRALALSDRWWNQKGVAQDYRAGELGVLEEGESGLLNAKNKKARTRRASC